jgi:lipoyl(octanoyl) transferase
MKHDVMTERPVLTVRDLGVMEYTEALAIQHQTVDARLAEEIADTLLLVEHPPVFTLGRRSTSRQNVLMPGDTPVVEVERGGDVTWHGPGQLVGYPIIKLREDEGERDLHDVLRRLEEAFIAVLSRCDLKGERVAGHTGVWSEGRKLVSLGIAVRGWVTYHGFALNVDVDLSWFARINPCGLSSQMMGSVRSLAGRVPDPEVLKTMVAQEVAGAFERTNVMHSA